MHTDECSLHSVFFTLTLALSPPPAALALARACRALQGLPPPHWSLGKEAAKASSWLYFRNGGLEAEARIACAAATASVTAMAQQEPARERREKRSSYLRHL